ncbi:MAG: NUDIX hydrolase [Planktothrix sp. GU0601_MAG3]|nr:MAG: NUDIX hydrolase [Planktothrix sp. GU0601_MAG3]
MIQVAIGILYRDGKFLLQLRDNNPNIVHPGVWGLFGGHLEPGETPENGFKRELLEEIGYNVPEFVQFKSYPDSLVNRIVFYAPLTVDLSQLVLNEGWDMGLLTPGDIQAGECYSEKAGMVRLIGNLHRKILSDFIAQNLV